MMYSDKVKDFCTRNKKLYQVVKFTFESLRSLNVLLDFPAVIRSLNPLEGVWLPLFPSSPCLHARVMLCLELESHPILRLIKIWMIFQLSRKFLIRINMKQMLEGSLLKLHGWLSAEDNMIGFTISLLKRVSSWQIVTYTIRHAKKGHGMLHC